MSHPTCAYSCIAIIASEDPCNLQFKCLCTSTNYLNGFHRCINEFCDAAGIQAWIAYGQSGCAALGVVFSATGVTASQTLGALSTTVVLRTSIFTPAGAPASTAVAGGFPFETTTVPSASVAGIQPATTSTTPLSAQTSQDSKSGLGVGAIAGIGIGAAAVVVIAILGAFLIWGKRRKPTKARPPEIARAQAVESNNQRPDMERQFQSGTTTGLVYSPGLSAEQGIYTGYYEGENHVPDTKSEQVITSQQLNPVQVEPLHHVSPVSASTELATVLHSEAPTSTRAPSDYGPPYRNAVEVDSTRQSHITSPVSAIGSNPYERHQELSASPYLTPHELSSSSPATMPATTIPIAQASASSAGIGARTDNGDDAELDRMKAEIEAVRAEKEHVLRLKALEERERELSRNIVNRELSKGAGS